MQHDVCRGGLRSGGRQFDPCPGPEDRASLWSVGHGHGPAPSQQAARHGNDGWEDPRAALGRLVTTLDVIGLEAFVPEPPRGAGRPPDDRRALARAFVAKAVLGVPTTTALIERLDVDRSLRRILGWERRSQVPSEATFSRAFA